MKKYIDQEEAEKIIAEVINHNGTEAEILTEIHYLPVADVMEVRHGRWIQKGRKIYCSKCNRGVYIGTDDEGLMQDEMRLRHFCSACGARMDEV